MLHELIFGLLDLGGRDASHLVPAATSKRIKLQLIDSHLTFVFLVRSICEILVIVVARRWFVRSEQGFFSGLAQVLKTAWRIGHVRSSEGHLRLV